MARHLARQLLPRMLVAGVITVVLTTLFSLPSGTAHADGSFETTTEYFFCNHLRSGFNGPAPLPGDPNCTSDFSPDASPDFGFTWTVPSGDYNFSTYANFISDDFSIAADADIDDGTAVGGNSSRVTLGLLTGACNSAIYPDFILYDSTTNTSNTVDALAEGTPDRFSNLANDGGDGFPGQADSNSPAVLQYPSFLNTLLDPDLEYPGGPNGGTPPISPHARYTGLTQVPPGDDWIFFTILVFEKSQLDPFDNSDNATHPFARYGRNPDEAGWVHILVLQDPNELVTSVGPISDFCSSLIARIMLLGQVTDTTHGTVSRLTSPAAGTGIDSEGTHPLLLYAMSVRDTDGDGVENSLDTCPFDANVDDPRATAGADSDMIDPACDPDPNAFENGGDIDGDVFLNSQDNCPLAANATQAQAEKGGFTHVQTAPDAGFRHDWIGDACDSEQGGSDDVADGAFLHDMDTAAACISDDPLADEDGDGWCSLSPGADPNDSDANITGAPNIDTDGDGYPNDDELFMQTDPLVDCPLVSGSHDAWPSDMDSSGTANLLDLLVFKPAFNCNAGDPCYSARVDLDVSGIVNLLDLLPFKPDFNVTC